MIGEDDDQNRRCNQCYELIGDLWKATYVGAPEGGVWVHIRCLKAFFDEIDRAPFRY